jgi:ribose/xylose/arabinose/galactoside ABC-type transport system permease subunit
MNPTNEWWSIESTGLIFGIAGAAAGLLGGLYGILCGFLVPRGKGKPIVYGLFAMIVVVGAASVMTGLIALLIGQPRHVFQWLLLVGGVLLVATLPSGLMIPMWYRQAEQRRLEATELRKSY